MEVVLVVIVMVAMQTIALPNDIIIIVCMCSLLSFIAANMCVMCDY